ncbi:MULTISPECIES: AAA family ATPase [unclassified Microbacterium]|uniref:AAA family ATPase n=1 Tax=unclassified Microbacterium TaxID=2609290 RepID=UPI00300F8A74
MRLHRLEIEGFGPFLRRQVIDFDAFSDDGIFLIAGRTGAGKSSILDAVCFGLYGGVPRYDGGEKRLRSDHCEPEDPTEVVVEFSTVAGRFRVTRSPEYLRPAKRGGGLTKQAAAVALEEHTDAGWVGRAARAVDVANELADILQLTQEQFLQVILLAQNRFADFLLSDSRDRLALLRRLFGTERFEDYQTRFEDRRRAAEAALGGRRATVEARLAEAERIVDGAGLHGRTAAEDEDGADVGDSTPAAEPRRSDADEGIGEAAPTGIGARSTPERIAALRRALARADYRVERLRAERDAAESALAAADERLATAKEERQAQSERDRARAALAALDAEAERVAEDRERRDRARSAEALRSVLKAASRAQAAEKAAVQAEDAARAAWERYADETVGPDAEAADLRAWASDRTRESGAWQRAADLEQRHPERERELAEARREATEAAEELAAVERESEELPAQILELTALRDAARREGDRVDDLRRAEEESAARLRAASEMQRLDEQRTEAERRSAAAAGESARAQGVVAALRQRRLDGFAGELASALVPGEPCAVCGSTEHPAPAEHADPVSAEDVAQAEAVRDAAASAEREAVQREASVRAELAAVTERAGGRTVAQAEDERDRAREAWEAAQAAAARAEEHERALTAAHRRREENGARHDEAVRTLAEAREKLVRCEQRAAEADAEIARARGEHESVAERLDDLRRAIAAAVDAAMASEERASRTAAAEEAFSAQRRALEESPFADAEAAEAALLAPTELAALESRLTAHAVQREKERDTLLHLELRMLPEEPIDLDPVTRAAADAREAWKLAVGAAARAEETAVRLRGLVDDAEAEHAVSAEEQAEFDVLRGLADTLAGRGENTRKMNLETFVLAAELEEIVAAATLRLQDMSSGRYQLRHSDALAARGAASGLGIVVFDAFTGQTRPARSLSGGETFLGSLALALGLAEVVTARAGGIRLDTLFIDEGFGSLDADTLEVAMRTLDELRQGGRTVGVISHVEAMQEQIPAQLTVRATPDGPSVIDAPRSVGPGAGEDAGQTP